MVEDYGRRGRKVGNAAKLAGCTGESKDRIVKGVECVGCIELVLSFRMTRLVDFECLGGRSSTIIPIL